jgi:LmbE family N-acetylglucosaminyl deacetylase
MNRTLVVSPHLDDAVLGCGQWLADHPGALVVTVFAGLPREPMVSTDWDLRCGFASAVQALATRREEDRLALAMLRAAPMWLDHVDSQYGQADDEAAIVADITQALAIALPPLVLLPLGLFHSDHLLAHRAALAALGKQPAASVWAYEDALYRRRPGLLQMRLCELQQAGLTATPVVASDKPTGPLKRTAVEAYASQARAFGEGGLDDAARPERFWALTR